MLFFCFSLIFFLIIEIECVCKKTLISGDVIKRANKINAEVSRLKLPQITCMAAGIFYNKKLKRHMSCHVGERMWKEQLKLS